MPSAFDAFSADEIDAELDAAEKAEAAAAAAAATNYLAMPADPSLGNWPATLALELAMRVGTPKEVCQAHGITSAQWNLIRVSPVFQAEVAGAQEALRKDGANFKARAGLQAVELLKVSWEMIHNRSTPPAVRARLIEVTIAAAGLDESKRKTGGTLNLMGGGGSGASAFHLAMHLGE